MNVEDLESLAILLFFAYLVVGIVIPFFIVGCLSSLNKKLEKISYYIDFLINKSNNK